MLVWHVPHVMETTNAYMILVGNVLESGQFEV
jgi:hypothetical protein